MLASLDFVSIPLLPSKHPPCPAIIGPRLASSLHIYIYIHASNMLGNSNDSLLRNLEAERLAIWDTHPTEQARQHAWAQRKAQLVSYLVNDTSAPRTLHQELDGRTQALSDDAGGEVCTAHLLQVNSC